MIGEGGAKAFAETQNAFGFLRILLASLVILAHTPEIVDGNRGREIFSIIFGTTSAGDFAVNCFFIISGYLISKSFLSSTSVWSYLNKRVARIYPGFLVAFLFCIILVAPLGGAPLPGDIIYISRTVIDAILLQQPTVEGAFAGTPYPALNASMWTIAYEFRCYLLIIALGLSGILQRKYLLLASTLLFVLLATIHPPLPYTAWRTSPDGTTTAHLYSIGEMRNILVGNLRQDFRLIAMFLSGSCFYAFRAEVSFSRMKMIASAGLLISCLFVQPLVLVGTALFGSYFIFSVARINRGVLTRINAKEDISYGIYLYAWPVTKLLNWWAPALPLAAMIVLTWLFSAALGWLSWRHIEKPITRWARGKAAVHRKPVSV